MTRAITIAAAIVVLIYLWPAEGQKGLDRAKAEADRRAAEHRG